MPESIELAVSMPNNEIKVCVSLSSRGTCSKPQVWVWVLFKGLSSSVLVRFVCVWLFKHKGSMVSVCLEFSLLETNADLSCAATKVVIGGSCSTWVSCGRFDAYWKGCLAGCPVIHPNCARKLSSVPTPKSHWFANMATCVPTEAWLKPSWRLSALVLNWNCWLLVGGGACVKVSHPCSAFGQHLGVWVCMLCIPSGVCVCTDLATFLIE